MNGDTDWTMVIVAGMLLAAALAMVGLMVFVVAT